jgi:ribosomal-protein-alanine N-acetyltransferase
VTGQTAPDITPLPSGGAEPLAVMHLACFPDDPWDAAVLGHILALSSVFGYLAGQAGSPAGFILVRDLGEEAEILSVGVLPAMRRLGIGRALLDAVIAHARQRRIGSIVLEVATDNAAARRLYGAVGFGQVGRRPRYYRRTDRLADALILRFAIQRDVSGEPIRE